MLARPRNQGLLIRALEREFKKDPVRFFRTMIMPLLPREARVELGHDGVIQWKSLMGGVVAGGTTDHRPQTLDIGDSTTKGTKAEERLQGEGIVIDVEAMEATP